MNRLSKNDSWGWLSNIFIAHSTREKLVNYGAKLKSNINNFSSVKNNAELVVVVVYEAAAQE